jgi:hypothetical protein
MSNVRDQRRRAVGAPLADRSLCEPIAVPASGVPTRDDRCIALLGGAAIIVDIWGTSNCSVANATNYLPSERLLRSRASENRNWSSESSDMQK